MSVLGPRLSGELIASIAKNVSILDSGVQKVGNKVLEELRKEKFVFHEITPKSIKIPSGNIAADWIFFVDTLNFSFWSPESSIKYLVNQNGIPQTGYFALCAAVNRALEQNIPIVEPKFYSKISQQKFTEIFKSDSPTPIPLIDERVMCLQEAGSLLLDRYDGSFAGYLKKHGGGDAQEFLRKLVSDFSSYRDESEIGGKRVSFYKRAQILIADLWTHFKGDGFGKFSNIDSLTMFADYRVPQVLVYFGVLKYSPELMKKLEREEELRNGDDDEVEIRGCSINAVDRICNYVNEKVESDAALRKHRVNPAKLDYFLWNFRRENNEEMENIPFHKVRCIYY